MKTTTLTAILMLLSLWGEAQQYSQYPMNMPTSAGEFRIDILRPRSHIMGVEEPKYIKIGILEVDEETGQAYLKDCYEHPDTIEPRGAVNYIAYGKQNDRVEVDRARKLAREYTDSLILLSIGYCINSDGHFAYLIPRKPSEQDFIKWNYSRHKK